MKIRRPNCTIDFSRGVKVLTIQQPYAHYIIHGDARTAPHHNYKDIENRSWKTSYRGRLYIHAGKRWYDGPETDHPDFQRMTSDLGKIIGYVTLTGCVQKSCSSWFYGPWGFVLGDPVELEDPIPARGQQGFWNFVMDDPCGLERTAKALERTAKANDMAAREGLSLGGAW